MANLFFPQLCSGAPAQYPIKKMRQLRTIQNILPDGTLIQLPDPYASVASWQLNYTDLAEADMQAIQAHFQACVGSYHAFTFVDPTDNMLVSSADLTAPVWMNSGSLRIANGLADSQGGTQAFQLTNIGQASASLTQSLTVPANYQYCFSLYVSSLVPSVISLALSGSSVNTSNTYTVGSSWTRIVMNGRLNDPGTTFTVAVKLLAGQQVQVFGPQLEAQINPSAYRATSTTGGVYANAHFATSQLPVVAEGPNLFATSFTIEAVV
jgi:hypothetical protein